MLIMKPTIRDLNIRILNEDTFTIYDGDTLISTCHISDSEFEFIKESPCLGGSWIFKVPRGLRFNIHDEFVSSHLKELPDFLPYAENVYVTRKIVSCFNPIVPLDATFTYIHRFIADLYSDFYAKYEDEETEEPSKEFTGLHFYKMADSIMLGRLYKENSTSYDHFLLKYDYKENDLILSKVIDNDVKKISINTIDPLSDFKNNSAFLESIFPKTIRVIEFHELSSEYCCMIQDIFMKWFKFNYFKDLNFDLSNSKITFSF